MCDFNLLDPCISSVIFDGVEINTKYSDDHSDILKSENPDKHIEYFWVTFKDSILSHIGEDNSHRIKSFSKKLNDLQKKKEYNTIISEISDYMKKNINIICKCIINSNNMDTICHLHTNINRWKRIDPSFEEIINKDDIVKSVILLSKIIKKKNNHFIKVNKMIIDSFLISGTNKQKIKELFDFGIEHNICLIIEFLLNHVDLHVYLGEETDKYKMMRSSKLMKKLREQLDM